MVEDPGPHGQALVETALLLPIVFLTLALLLQLALLMFLHVKLQGSSLRLARHLALGQPPLVAEAGTLAEFRRDGRWGFLMPKSARRDLPEWRTYKGKGTASEKNCLAVADLTWSLRGSWYLSAGLPLTLLHAHDEIPCEPSGMADPS